jgi:uncharacterized membrane protein
MDDRLLPSHVEETVRAIEKLHADHHNEATPMERVADRATGLLGRPASLGFITALVILWIGGNLILSRIGGHAFDLPPFPWLEGVLSLSALYMAALILTTQRRADKLGALRAQMTLQLAILSEQKAAKIIALLEELRRDSPEVRDRIDVEANAMETPTDPHAVSAALKDIQPAQPPDGDGNEQSSS